MHQTRHTVNRRRARIFLAYPHRPAARALVTSVLRPVLQCCGAEGVLFAASDDRHILDLARDQIAQCDALIAVVAGRNPHVFLEAGIALGLGKPCLAIASHHDDLGMLAAGQHVVLGWSRPEAAARLIESFVGALTQADQGTPQGAAPTKTMAG